MMGLRFSRRGGAWLLGAVGAWCIGVNVGAADAPHASAEAAHFAPAPPDKPAALRPRVCVVLSGGGARGMAHIGVLEALEDLKIPIDCIAGTSMGAVVGGLYASGMTRRMKSILTLRSVDWQEAFRDAPPRRDPRVPPQGQDDRQFSGASCPLGTEARTRYCLPKGFIQGQKLQETLRQLTLPFSNDTDFSTACPRRFGRSRPIWKPVQCRADGKGRSGRGHARQYFSTGRVCAGGVRGPTVGGRRPGGKLAHRCGAADACRHSHRLRCELSSAQPRAALDSALSISNQMLAILVRKDANRQRATLGSQDVLIEPQFWAPRVPPISPWRRNNTIASGENRRAPATGATGRTRRRRYGVPRLPGAARGTRARFAAEIKFVRVDPQSKRYEKTIMAEMKPLIGKPLDLDAVGKRITDLYGLGNFETLDYGLVKGPDVKAPNGESDGMHGPLDATADDDTGLESTRAPQILGP